MGKLKLKINHSKSAVDHAWKRKFLGYRFWLGAGRVVNRKVAPQALEKFKNKVRSLTTRNGGKSLEQVVEKLNVYLVGWKSYFRLADTPKIFSELDSWIRRKLRVIQLKHWKQSKTAYRELTKRGLPSKLAYWLAKDCRSYWRAAGKQSMSYIFPPSFFDGLGLTRLKA